MTNVRGLVVVAAVGLLGSAPAHAQMYKCEDGGRIVFSDTPCSVDAERVQVRPATGQYDPGAGARARLETTETLSRFAAEDAARRTAREQAFAARAAERAAKQDRCAEMRENKTEAEYWAREYRHPDNIRREKEKAKNLEDRLWWECRQVE